MNKKLIAGLALLNLGVFLATATFLPRAGTYTYSNPVERLINARTRWDIAWGAALSSSLVSGGFVLLSLGLRARQ